MRGGGSSNPLNTRVWGSHNSPVKKFGKFKGDKAIRSEGNKNFKIEQLLSDFVCPDFIKNLLPSKAFTMADRLSRVFTLRCKFAFTMAEILISLTIIGVIAAITLPALRANINESAWKAQRKALYSRLSQAIEMMPKLNGYGTYSASYDESGSLNITADTAAMAFVTDGLQQVLKINNICDNDNLEKCGIPAKITPMTGDAINFPKKLSELNPRFIATSNPQSNIDTKVAGLETVNGVSVAVFYNPDCQMDLKETTNFYVQTKMCANFVYDLNGRKGPNKVGKDIGFITALYSTNPNILAPMPLEENAKNTKIAQTAAAAACKAQDSDSRVPNRDELTAMFYNKQLINITSGNFWSGSVVSAGSPGTAWYQNFATGNRSVYGRSATYSVRCVRR